MEVDCLLDLRFGVLPLLAGSVTGAGICMGTGSRSGLIYKLDTLSGGEGTNELSPSLLFILAVSQ